MTGLGLVPKLVQRWASPPTTGRHGGRPLRNRSIGAKPGNAACGWAGAGEIHVRRPQRPPCAGRQLVRLRLDPAAPFGSVFEPEAQTRREPQGRRQTRRECERYVKLVVVETPPKAVPASNAGLFKYSSLLLRIRIGDARFWWGGLWQCWKRRSGAQSLLLKQDTAVSAASIRGNQQAVRVRNCCNRACVAVYKEVRVLWRKGSVAPITERDITLT